MRKRNRAGKFQNLTKSAAKREPIYSVADAAEMYGKSPAYINKLLVSNSIDPVRESDGRAARLYYKKSDVIALGRIMGWIDDQAK